VSKLVDGSRVEERFYFCSGDQSHLTYTLACDSVATSPQAQYTGREILVVVPRDKALIWAATDQVGIYATVDLGLHRTLELIVEKDFTCMDLSDADNLDAFPNPKARG